MATDWDDVGYVVSSKYRTAVLRVLSDGPATPTTIADESGLGITHISRALGRLQDRDVVELAVPEDQHKGRFYDLTEQGEELWGEMETTGMTA